METDLFGRAGEVPVGEWNARGGRVYEFVDRSHERVEIFLIVRKGRGPDFPVKLGVVGAIVERKSVLVELRLVVLHFLFGNFLGEEFEIEEAIPNDVVLHAPGVGTVKGETVMIAVVGEFNPLSGEFVRFFAESFRVVGVSGALAKIGVARERDDRLRREVGVMSEMPREVVGAQLIFRIKTLIEKIFGPRL